MFDLCNFCRKLECPKVSPVFFLRASPKSAKKIITVAPERCLVCVFQHHPCRLAGSQATFLIETGDRLKRKEVVRVSSPEVRRDRTISIPKVFFGGSRFQGSNSGGVLFYLFHPFPVSKDPSIQRSQVE